MMTPQQRYMLDTFGFLKLEGALSAEELAAAQEAAERYISAATAAGEGEEGTGQQLPEGFEQDPHDNRRFVYGFAFDKALEALATHPAIMPVRAQPSPQRCSPAPAPAPSTLATRAEANPARGGFRSSWSSRAGGRS